MTLSLDTSSSPSHLCKESISSTSMAAKNGSPKIISPCSDQRVWSALQKRVNTLVEARKSQQPSSISSTCEDERNLAKKMKEDSLLLLRGFDLIASSLSQFSTNLDDARQGARELAKPLKPLTEMVHSSSTDTKKPEDEVEDECCGQEHKRVKRKLDECCSDDQGEDSGASNKDKNQKLKKVKNLAISMATKSALLAKELKSVNSDMCFMKERCALLEEENRRLREGFAKGIRPDEDDLVSLQLEALLSEKSRLATENANLTRENQCLRQLVEYHKFTTQDLSASYEQVIQGLCLDFSSPTAEDAVYGSDNDDIDPTTPKTPIDFDFQTPLGKNLVNEDAQLKD